MVMAAFTCPRCSDPTEQEYYGPCSTCVARLEQWAAERKEEIRVRLSRRNPEVS